MTTDSLKTKKQSAAQISSYSPVGGPGNQAQAGHPSALSSNEVLWANPVSLLGTRLGKPAKIYRQHGPMRVWSQGQSFL